MKKLWPWLLGLAAAGGGGYWYWRKYTTGYKGVTVAQVTDTISKLAAMDDGKVEAANKLTKSQISKLVTQFDHDGKASLQSIALGLKNRGYVNLANGFLTQSQLKYGA
jgi:hypothetical protein